VEILVYKVNKDQQALRENKDQQALRENAAYKV
jgi:hypothetical protein